MSERKKPSECRYHSTMIVEIGDDQLPSINTVRAECLLIGELGALPFSSCRAAILDVSNEKDALKKRIAELEEEVVEREKQMEQLQSERDSHESTSNAYREMWRATCDNNNTLAARIAELEKRLGDDTKADPNKPRVTGYRAATDAVGHDRHNWKWFVMEMHSDNTELQVSSYIGPDSYTKASLEASFRTSLVSSVRIEKRERDRLAAQVADLETRLAEEQEAYRALNKRFRALEEISGLSKPRYTVRVDDHHVDVWDTTKGLCAISYRDYSGLPDAEARAREECDRLNADHAAIREGRHPGQTIGGTEE